MKKSSDRSSAYEIFKNSKYYEQLLILSILFSIARVYKSYIYGYYSKYDISSEFISCC